jgi:hypothetical protein
MFILYVLYFSKTQEILRHQEEKNVFLKFYSFQPVHFYKWLIPCSASSLYLFQCLQII